MEHATQEWLHGIAEILLQHKGYLETKTDINYDELGLDYLGGSLLFLYQTAINDGILEASGNNVNVKAIAELGEEERCDFVLAAGTCAKQLVQYKESPDTMTDDGNSLLQLSRAYLYLYNIYYKDIDIKL